MNMFEESQPYFSAKYLELFFSSLWKFALSLQFDERKEDLVQGMIPVVHVSRGCKVMLRRNILLLLLRSNGPRRRSFFKSGKKRKWAWKKTTKKVNEKVSTAKQTETLFNSNWESEEFSGFFCRVCLSFICLPCCQAKSSTVVKNWLKISPLSGGSHCAGAGGWWDATRGEEVSPHRRDLWGPRPVPSPGFSPTRY